MAWLIDAATDKVLVPSGWSGSVATVVMWIRRNNTTTTHGNNPWRAWSNAAGGGSTLAGLDAQGSSRNTLLSFDSAFSNITGGAMGDGLWHCIALLMNTTSWALFYGTNPDSLTKVTGTKASTGTVGSWTFSDAAPDFFDGIISNVKLFSRALSDSEVALELATPAQVSATNLVFRGTLDTISTTPETGTTMTAGGTAVTVTPGPGLGSSSTTTSTTAAARLAGVVTSTTTTSTTAAARLAGAATSTTTTATTAAARLAGTATSTTTTATTTAARLAGVVTSTTTTSTTAAARLAGAVTSTTTTSVTATARGLGEITTVTTTSVRARARDLNHPQPPGPYRAGTPTLVAGWRSTGASVEPGWHAGTVTIG